MSAPQSADLLMHLLRRWWGTISTRDSQAFSLDWVNDYIQQVWYSSWVVTKLNDGTRDYRQCYGWSFNIGDTAVHGLDNRSVQTMKFVWTIDNLLNIQALASYTANWWSDIHTSWAVRVYLPWTGSITISSTTTITPWSVYNVVVRINNTLPSWTARVVWDADIFISWTKSWVTSAGQANNTTNNSTLLWWWSTTTTQQTYWCLYSFSLRNRALSDAECQAEWLSNWAVVTPSWLVNTRDTSNTSQAVSRTWYNLTWGGNYSIATDADGKFIKINWNRDQTAWTWTLSFFSWWSFSFTQTSTFSFAFKVKINSLPPNNYSWIFWSWNNFAACLQQSWGNFIRIVSKPTYSRVLVPITLWVACTIHVCYEPTTWKAYVYKDWVIQNSWWTAMSPTFTAWSWILWDTWSETNTLNSSSDKNIYFARVWQRTLTQSDVTADISSL